jgi:hypothetical protein
LVAGILLFITTPFLASAQTDPIVEDSNIRPFTASGSIGISASTYTASGITNRRAPASLQSTANLDFSLFGFSSGLNLLYSTDQSEFRQNMNNISFDAQWKWITVQAGDVSPSFSKYGLSGATIRGGYLRFNPGNWNIELSGGRSKKAIPFNSSQDEFREPSFERWAMVGKVGYEGDGSHFYLSSHYELDKSESLNNPTGITPKENLTLTPDTKVSIFDGKISLESQVTFSAFTRDLNSTEVPLSSTGVPGFLSNLMQPHQSSRINYAGRAAANLRLDQFGFEVGYERIQPGFRSLGIGRIQDDKERIRLAPAVQLFDNKVSVQSNLTFGRDNLLNSRLQTQRNTGVGANVQVQVTNMITISSNYNLLINSFTTNSGAVSNSQSAPPDQKQVSHTLMLQPSVTLQRDENTHTISLSASYFNFNLDFEGSGSTIPTGSSSDTYSTNASYSLSFPSGLALNSMTNVVLNNSSSSENFTIGGNVGASYSLLKRKLTLSLNGGFNHNTSTSSMSNLNDVRIKTQQFMLNLTGNYRLTGKDSFSLSVRSRSNNVVEGGSSNYSELEASLRYQHRF